MLPLLSVKPIDLFNVSPESSQCYLHVFIQLVIGRGWVLLQSCYEVLAVGNCCYSQLEERKKKKKGGGGGGGGGGEKGRGEGEERRRGSEATLRETIPCTWLEVMIS